MPRKNLVYKQILIFTHPSALPYSKLYSYLSLLSSFSNLRFLSLNLLKPNLLYLFINITFVIIISAYSQLTRPRITDYHLLHLLSFLLSSSLLNSLPPRNAVVAMLRSCTLQERQLYDVCL